MASKFVSKPIKPSISIFGVERKPLSAFYSTTPKNDKPKPAEGRRWQIFSAVALRRLPVLMPKPDPIEQRVQEIMNLWEISKSKLSSHELEHIDNLKLKDSEEVETILGETAQDKEDRWNKEKSEFKFAEYDERLTLTHYLFVKQKFGTDIKDQWLLPQAQFNEKLDENLLDTARRALQESLNITNGYRIVSKIPSSVYSFRYPKKITDLTGGFFGARVFFMKAHLDLPNPSVLESLDDQKNVDNLRWLTKIEAFKSDLDISKKYLTSFKEGLLHEDRVDLGRVLEQASKYAYALRKLNV